nr:hypothetical protein [Tanacetum cinerariifolium]
LHYCQFSCFLSQEEPKKIFDALKGQSRVEAMQHELLQFKIQNVWVLVDCPNEVRPIGMKWVLKNKKDERGIVIRNKAPYASYMGFTVYQMDVKKAFLYRTIDEEVYVMQPPGFQDPKFLHRVYKVEKAMYGLHQAPRAWYGTFSKYLLNNGFQRGVTWCLAQAHTTNMISGLDAVRTSTHQWEQSKTGHEYYRNNLILESKTKKNTNSGKLAQQWELLH